MFLTACSPEGQPCTGHGWKHDPDYGTFECRSNGLSDTGRSWVKISDP